MSDASHPDDYERSDADPCVVAALAIGLALFLLAVPLALSALYPDAQPVLAHDLPRPPAPRLQIDPSVDLAHLRAQEDARLNSVGWADRDRRTVHIPIGRAMDLTAERGWPAPPVNPPQR